VDSRGKYGRRSVCIPCFNKAYRNSAEYARAYAVKNKDRIKSYKHQWYMADRERQLERRHNRYIKNKDHENSQSKRYHANNREAIMLWQREYAENNRERIRAIKSRWEKNNPNYMTAKNAKRRAVILGADGCYTAIEWQLLKEQYGHRCLMCGKNEDEITLTADHVIPLSKGGSNDISNLQPLCLSCNSKKGTKVIDLRNEGRN